MPGNTSTNSIPLLAFEKDCPPSMAGLEVYPKLYCSVLNALASINENIHNMF